MKFAIIIAVVFSSTVANLALASNCITALAVPRWRTTSDLDDLSLISVIRGDPSMISREIQNRFLTIKATDLEIVIEELALHDKLIKALELWSLGRDFVQIARSRPPDDFRVQNGYVQIYIFPEVTKFMLAKVQDYLDRELQSLEAGHILEPHDRAAAVDMLKFLYVYGQRPTNLDFINRYLNRSRVAGLVMAADFPDL